MFVDILSAAIVAVCDEGQIFISNMRVQNHSVPHSGSRGSGSALLD